MVAHLDIWWMRQLEVSYWKLKMVSASQSCFLNRKKMKQVWHRPARSHLTWHPGVFENRSEKKRRPSCAEDAERKLNNIMLKVTPKLPVTLTASRAAHNVVLASPHRLLTKEEVGICTRKIQDHVNVMYMIWYNIFIHIYIYVYHES